MLDKPVCQTVVESGFLGLCRHHPPSPLPLYFKEQVSLGRASQG